MDDTSNPLWTFSLSVYKQPDVPPACLDLQAAYSADVNLILFCLFLARYAEPKEARTLLKAGIDAVETWHTEVVRPLRRIRQQMKPGLGGVPKSLSDPLREKIKAVELNAEHVEQTILWRSLGSDLLKDDGNAGDGQAVALLEEYFSRLNVELDPSHRPAVDTLIRAALAASDK